MSSNTEAQTHISQLVGEYKRVFPQEYQAFLSSVRAKKTELALNNKHGALEKTDMIQRALLEYPETLYTIFEKVLSKESLEYLTSKTGARWFGKAHPEFLIVKI